MRNSRRTSAPSATGVKKTKLDTRLSNETAITHVEPLPDSEKSRTDPLSRRKYMSIPQSVDCFSDV